MTTSAEAARPFDALTVPLDAGATLVEASAGTGKTFAITRLVLRLLLERRVDSLGEILVVTFTDKATQELVTRIRRVLRDADRVFSATPPTETPATADLFRLREVHGAAGAAIIRAALGALDRLGVSTIHGFCARVLAEHALETQQPFTTTLLQDDTEPLMRAAMDWMRRRLLTNDASAAAFVAADTTPGALKKSYVDVFRRQPNTALLHDPYVPEQAVVADFVHTVDATFAAEKARRHLLSFDDLLRALASVLSAEGPAGPLASRLRTRYRAALVDEFQDTDGTQATIFRTIFDGAPLFLIGDPKQSIYAFRGADIAAYLDAADAAVHRYTLTTNYRSTAACVQAVEQLFTRVSRPFGAEAERIGFPRVTAGASHAAPGTMASDGHGAMVWWWVDGSLGRKGKTIAKADAEALIFGEVANEVVRLIAAAVPPGSIAVLARSNKQVAAIRQRLELAGVPAVVAGGEDVLRSEEAGELVRLAAAMAAPYDRRAVSSALATRLWGWTASEISAASVDGADAAWTAVTDGFAALRDLWRGRGVAAAFNAALAVQRTTERLLALPDGERRVTNVRHVIELLQRAAAEEGLLLEGVAAWVAGELEVVNTPDRRTQRLETDADAVQVLTMHKAKGLEFDVVFCPTLWETFDTKPGPFGLMAANARDADGRMVLDLGTAAQAPLRQAMQAAESAEALRLAYVALTRARHRTYIAFGDIGSGNSAANSAIGYLLREEGGVSARDVLAQLVAASGGSMSLVALSPDAPLLMAAPTRGTADGATDVRALVLAPEQLSSWRLTSFTSLTASAPTHDGRDVSDVAVPGDAVVTPIGFRAFPAGTQAGIALHALFERLDFTRAHEPTAADLVTRTLSAHGLLGDAQTAAHRVPDVLQMVQRVCTAPVPGGGFALTEVPFGATLREWRFDMSVGTASVRKVADALAAHGSAHAQAYAPILRGLRDSDVAGYLTGVIDLVLEHAGRWWIVDWKSNQLGGADARYEPAVLESVMHEAHYTLQYHLYVLALHRHLRVRLPGYDPATHLGGVAYVFLRGVDGQGARGWFTENPSAALVMSLDDVMGRRA